MIKPSFVAIHGKPSRRARRAALRVALPAIGLALATLSCMARAQALTSPVAPATAPTPSRESAGATLQTSNLGEAQIDFLLKLAQDAQQPNRGLPLDIFRERVLGAVVVHPEVLALRASLSGTRQSTRELEAARLPQVSARGEVSSHRLDRSTINGVPKREYETASAGLTLSQSVYDFGVIDTSVLASKERSAAVQARLDGRRDELALRAVQTWHDVIRSRRLLAQLQLNQQSLENMVGYLTRRFDLGGGPISDVWRAQARLADARASLASAQTRVRIAEAGYREVFDAAPGALDLPALPVVDRQAIAAAATDLVREYPAVRGAEASRRAAEQELDLTLRRERPTLGLEVSAQRRDMVGRGAPGNDVSASLVMRYSFYSGGADQARAAQAAFRAVEAAEQVRGLTVQVDRALAQSLAAEEYAAATLAARREGVTLAVQALRAVREQFANRRGNLLDLLNAQEVLHAAGVGLTEAEIDEALARWQVLYYSTSYWPLAVTVAPASP
ncbi:MAG: TolC family protein [Burkholderiaceae bacterium]